MVPVVATATALVAGALLGLSLAAPPGPMNAVIAEESVLRGWFAGFKAGAGAMTADSLFCVLAFAGAVTFVQNYPVLRRVMTAAGGVLMLYFAYLTFRDASADDDVTTPDESRGFAKAFTLAVTNPYQITWWLTVGVTLVQPRSVEVLGAVVTTGGLDVLAGFFGGIFVWITVFPASLVAGGRRSPRFSSFVAYFSAVVLAGFGLVFVYSAVW